MDWSSSVVSGTPKPPWDHMPSEVRARIEELVGRIESVEMQHGGFTPSVAARVRLAGGGGVFVKAADAATFPHAAAMHRSEAEFLAGLDAVGEVPDLIASFERDGWVVLVLEAVDGRHPHLPWQPDELERTLDGLTRLSARLTPSPVSAPTVGQRWGPDFGGWRRLRDDPAAVDRLGLAPVAGNVDRLAAIEEGWPEAAEGDTLLHADLRADQILLSEAGLRVVDWPHACIGAAWIDPLFFFPSVRLQGGPQLDTLIQRCEQTAAAPREELMAVAVAITGFFLHGSTLPSPPGLPTVRAFQRAQGEVMAVWLDETLDRA